MFEFAKMFLEWLKDRSPAGLARICAFLLIPGGVLVLVLSGMLGESLRWDLSRPLTIAELKTELSADGSVTSKSGVALIFEPTSGDQTYNFQFQANSPNRAWTSLEEKNARGNSDRLKVSKTGITSNMPFLGMNDPVTVVVEGQLDDSILLSAGSVKKDNWQLPSRRSESIVASVLLSCAVAFGISIARGFPSADRSEHTTS